MSAILISIIAYIGIIYFGNLFFNSDYFICIHIVGILIAYIVNNIIFGARKNYQMEINTDSIFYKHDVKYKKQWDKISEEIREKINKPKNAGLFYLLFIIGILAIVVIVVLSFIFSGIGDLVVILIPITGGFLVIANALNSSEIINLKFINNENLKEDYMHYFTEVGKCINEPGYFYYNGFYDGYYIDSKQSNFISRESRVKIDKSKTFSFIKFDNCNFCIKTVNRNGNNLDFFFYPTFFVEQGLKTSFFYYKDLEIDFFESIAKVDSRAEISFNLSVVDSSWKHANKDGSKNRVYADRNNYEIYDVKVGNIKLGSEFWLIIPELDMYNKMVDCITQLLRYSEYNIIDNYESDK